MFDKVTLDDVVILAALISLIICPVGLAVIVWRGGRRKPGR